MTQVNAKLEYKNSKREWMCIGEMFDMDNDSDIYPRPREYKIGSYDNGCLQLNFRQLEYIDPLLISLSNDEVSEWRILHSDGDWYTFHARVYRLKGVESGHPICCLLLTSDITEAGPLAI